MYDQRENNRNSFLTTLPFSDRNYTAKTLNNILVQSVYVFAFLGVARSESLNKSLRSKHKMTNCGASA